MYIDYLANKHQYRGATELTRGPCYWILGLALRRFDVSLGPCDLCRNSNPYLLPEQLAAQMTKWPPTRAIPAAVVDVRPHRDSGPGPPMLFGMGFLRTPLVKDRRKGRRTLDHTTG